MIMLIILLLPLLNYTYDNKTLESLNSKTVSLAGKIYLKETYNRCLNIIQTIRMYIA